MSMAFGKFELEKQLAIGGMAEVFLACQTGPAGFSKRLCIKRILPKLASDSTFVEMFLDEARTAALLNHPNIVQIYELGEIDGSYYIAMEYIRGPALSKLIRRLRDKRLEIPFHYAAKIVADVCAGLEYAHTFADADGTPLHLVHRDISPDNVLVSEAGNVKMIDFGIAKAVTNTSKTQVGAVKGKFSYMSPEQVKGLNLDARSDLFSLGIVLYELLTLRKPFGDEADLMTVSAIVHDPPRSAREVLSDVPVEMEAILEKALAKEPIHRYQSAAELQRDLEEFMRSRGEFVGSRDIGLYVQRVMSDAEEDIETLRRLGSAIRMKLTGAEGASDSGGRDADGRVAEPTPAHRATPVRAPEPEATSPAAPARPAAPTPAPPAPSPNGHAPPQRRLLWGLLAAALAAAAGTGGYFAWNHYASSEDTSTPDSGGAPAVKVEDTALAARSTSDATVTNTSVRTVDGGDAGQEGGPQRPSADSSGATIRPSTGQREPTATDGDLNSSPDASQAAATPDARAAEADGAASSEGTQGTDDTNVAGTAGGEGADAHQAAAAPLDAEAGYEGGTQHAADSNDAAVAAADAKTPPLGTGGPGVVPLHRPDLMAALLAKDGTSGADEPIPAAKQEALRNANAGLLRVRTEPAMTIYVDGHKRGVSPTELELPAGDHRVELRSLSNNVKRFARVQVPRGSATTLRETLVAGLLNVGQIESGIEVFLNGDFVGTTPLDPLPIWEGQHQVRLKRTDGQTISRTVTVTARSREHILTVRW